MTVTLYILYVGHVMVILPFHAALTCANMAILQRFEVLGS